jgi:hypothetical protein
MKHRKREYGRATYKLRDLMSPETRVKLQVLKSICQRNEDKARHEKEKALRAAQ